MPASIVTVGEKSLHKDIKNLVRKTVEESPDALLDEDDCERRFMRSFFIEADKRRLRAALYCEGLREVGGVMAEILSGNGSKAGCRSLSKAIVILHVPAVMLLCFL